jgi:ribosomal protein L11 methyltransferase
MFYRFSPAQVLRSWWRPYRARPGERVLVIRGASVFPPGHPSTLLALDLLKEVLATGPCGRLLDVGCGSGVLLLAAAASGVSCCVGVDLSRQAARVSRDNARQNGLAGSVHLAQGSTQCLRGPFGVILANLPWTVQLEKWAELSRLGGQNSHLILAGFKDTQEEELRGLYLEEGWRLKHRCTREEWVPELPPDKSFTWVAWLLTRP